MNKKILLFTILGMFLLIPFASATILDYDSNTRTATFHSNILFIKTGEIATAQLITPLNFKVGLGYQYVWEQKITGFDSYQDFISEMEFYDKKNGMAQINKNYDLKKKEIIQVEVDDYECSEKLTTNSTNNTMENICVISGSHLEDREIWTKLKQVDFKKNDVLYVRMYVDVQEGDVVEWIPTQANKRVTQWASWTADLNTDLFNYWTFDEPSGNLLDSIGNSNGTLSGTITQGATGKINDAYNFTGQSDAIINMDNQTINTNGQSFSFWIKKNTAGVRSVVYRHGSTPTGFYIEFNINEKFVYNHASGPGKYTAWTTTNAFSIGVWHHVVVTGTGTTQAGVHIYVDGVDQTGLDYGTNEEGVRPTGSSIRFFGKADNAAGYLDAGIDEFGWWKRVLTQTEVTQLWNNSYGISYTIFGTDPTVTSISPANDTTYTASPQSVDFTCYGSDGEDFTEMEFYLNGVLEQTNSSGINNTNYVFTESLTDGDYYWECIGYDDEANTGTSENRTLTVDTTPNIQYVSPTPTNASNLTTKWSFQ